MDEAILAEHLNKNDVLMPARNYFRGCSNSRAAYSSWLGKGFCENLYEDALALAWKSSGDKGEEGER
jgi:hypothetical protein